MSQCFSIKPFSSEAAPNVVIVDGFAEKENLLGPYRMQGNAVYYDPRSGAFLDARSNTYIRDSDWYVKRESNA